MPAERRASRDGTNAHMSVPLTANGRTSRLVTCTSTLRSTTPARVHRHLERPPPLAGGSERGHRVRHLLEVVDGQRTLLQPGVGLVDDADQVVGEHRLGAARELEAQRAR